MSRSEDVVALQSFWTIVNTPISGTVGVHKSQASLLGVTYLSLVTVLGRDFCVGTVADST